ncbi:hypothetical protein HELRODRAFT_195030 [Helobdella robusta]|uniref:Uncharacterized protein n=1 Tax=Helobdella robusta TaxID=6412 RepID=T1FWP0_HELRO|nr:hypothetical protein HELRODRAFT_195030 [Helobdella robusta]ESO09757.1 hypothetical protein HELRODRAFT_195030 [Helobdella robusta]
MWSAGVDINKQNVDNSKWGTGLSSSTATDTDLWRPNNSMTSGSGWGSVNQSPVPNAGTEGWSSSLHSQTSNNLSVLPQNDNRLNFGGFQSNNLASTQPSPPAAAQQQQAVAAAGSWSSTAMGPAGAWSRGNPMSNQVASSSSSSSTSNQTLALGGGGGGGPSSWAEAVASKQSSNNSNNGGSTAAANVVNISSSSASNQSTVSSSSAQATSNNNIDSIAQMKKTQEEMIARAINSNEGWGKTVIRQDTAWIIDDPAPAISNESSFKDSHSESEHQTTTALTAKQIITGTAIWENLKTNQKPAEIPTIATTTTTTTLSSSTSSTATSWDPNNKMSSSNIPTALNSSQDVLPQPSTFRPVNLDIKSNVWPSQPTTTANVNLSTSNLNNWGSNILPDAPWTDGSATAPPQVKKDEERSPWGLAGSSEIGSKSTSDLGISCWERPNIPLHRSSSTGSWMEETSNPSLDITGTKAWGEDKSGSQSILNEIDDGTSLWGDKLQHPVDGWRQGSAIMPANKNMNAPSMRKSDSDVFTTSNPPNNPLALKLGGYSVGPLDDLSRPWNQNVPLCRTSESSSSSGSNSTTAWGSLENNNNWMSLLAAQNNNNNTNNNNANNNNNIGVPRLKTPSLSNWTENADWSNRMATSLMKANMRTPSLHDLASSSVSSSSSSSSTSRFNPHHPLPHPLHGGHHPTAGAGAIRPTIDNDGIINNIDNPLDLFNLPNLQSLNLGASINNSANNINNNNNNTNLNSVNNGSNNSNNNNNSSNNISNNMNAVASNLIGHLRGAVNAGANSINNNNNNNNANVNGGNNVNNNNNANAVLNPFVSSLEMNSLQASNPMMAQLQQCNKPPPPIGSQLNNSSSSSMPLTSLLPPQQQQFMHHLLQSVQSAVQLNLIPAQIVNQHTITNSTFITMVQGLLKLHEAYQKLVLQSMQQVPPPTHSTHGGMLQQQRQIESTMNVLQQRIETLKQQILQMAATANISSISSPSTPNLASVLGGPPQQALLPSTAGSRLINQWKVSENNSSSNNSSSISSATNDARKHSSAMPSDASDMSSLASSSGANFSSSSLATWMPTSSSTTSWLESTSGDQKSTITPTTVANLTSATVSSSTTSSSSSSSTNQSSNVNELSAAAIPMLDIEEFVPGKPWQGPGTKNIEDDPYITPGSIINSLSTLKDTSSHKISSSSSSSSSSSLAASTANFTNSINNNNINKNATSLSTVLSLTTASNLSSSMSSSLFFTPPSFGQPVAQPSFPTSKLGNQWNVSDMRIPPPLSSNDLWPSSSSSSASASSFSINSNNNKQTALNNNNSTHNWNNINRSISWASGDRVDVGTSSSMAPLPAGHLPNNWPMSNGPSSWLLIKGIPQLEPTTLQNLCLQNGASSTLPNFFPGQLLACFPRIEDSIKVLRQLNGIRIGANCVKADYITDSDVTLLLSRMHQLTNTNGLGGLGGAVSAALIGGGAGLLGGVMPPSNNSSNGSSSNHNMPPFLNKMPMPGSDGFSFLGMGMRGGGVVHPPTHPPPSLHHHHHQWNQQQPQAGAGLVGNMSAGMIAAGVSGSTSSWSSSISASTNQIGGPSSSSSSSSFWGPTTVVDDHDHNIFLPGDLLGGQ